MRRYRKGQTWRPPTAAESAAKADAVEGFRRSSASPQGRLTRGSDILVKTPVGGIPARVGDTIYSATCTRCVETTIADEKTILNTDESLLVCNIHTEDVAGDDYVMTRLTACGTRYVDQSTSVGQVAIQFEILSAGPFLGDDSLECDYVVAEVLHVSCQGTGVEVGDEVNVWDPSRCQFNIPIEVLIGSHGWAISVVNDTEDVVDCLYELAAEGACRWVVQTLCCVEEIYG